MANRLANAHPSLLVGLALGIAISYNSAHSAPFCSNALDLETKLSKLDCFFEVERKRKKKQKTRLPRIAFSRQTRFQFSSIFDSTTPSPSITRRTRYQISPAPTMPPHDGAKDSAPCQIPRCPRKPSSDDSHR